MRITSDLPRTITANQPVTAHLTVTNVGLPLHHLVLVSNLDQQNWETSAKGKWSIDGDCPGAPTAIPPVKGWLTDKYAFGPLAHGQTCHVTVHTVGLIDCLDWCPWQQTSFGWHVYDAKEIGVVNHYTDGYVSFVDPYYDGVQQVDGALAQNVTIRSPAHD